jgi:hypothetical protein
MLGFQSVLLDMTVGNQNKPVRNFKETLAIGLEIFNI